MQGSITLAYAGMRLIEGEVGLMVQARAIVEDERVSDLDLTERNNLDEEMQGMVDGVVKKYGFMPNFVKLFATD